MNTGHHFKHENPRPKANPISKLFFGWMISFIRKGKEAEFQLKDLFKCQDKDRSQILGDKLQRVWDEEIVALKQNNKKPSLLKALIKAHYFEFMLYGILWFILYAVIMCSQPLVLGKLLFFFSVELTDEIRTNIYLYGFLLIALDAAVIFIYHHCYFGLMCVAMRVKISTSSLVYRKIMRLSQKAMTETGAGQIINLLSNDVNRFDYGLLPLHSLWVMPFQVIFLTFIIWQQVGLSSLVGIIAMGIISLLVQGYMGKLSGDYRAKIAKKTDRRVQLMSEIVSGIQVIKMYAWENPFENLVKSVRALEMKDITVSAYLRGLYGSLIFFLDKLSLYLTITTYVLLGYSITAEKVYSLTKAYNILQVAVATWYPAAIRLGAEALISINRLQEFLLLEEKKVQINYEKPNSDVILSNINASWTTGATNFQNLNLKVPNGSLCVTIGPVGAGKSSLLQLLLGEMELTQGSIQVGGKISYSSQQPWLFQSTIRNNILFGQPYNKNRYNQIIEICALKPDFDQFPRRDRTIVGERGVSLSGGQKARVNLARAVYRQADIYLLDDPLSAVDTHVCNHLFEKCISQYLAGKTRILITHQLQYLQKADMIVVLNEGKIKAQGTFKELCEGNIDFTEYMVNGKEDGSTEMEEIEFIEETTLSKQRNLDSDKATSRKISSVSLTFIICVIVNFLWYFRTSNEDIKNCAEEIKIQPFSTNTTHDFSTDIYYSSDNRTHSDGSWYDELFDYVESDHKIKKIFKTRYSIYVYTVIIGGVIVFVLARGFIFYKTCTIASTNLHNKMFHKLLQAPIRFFDTNPSGRTLNRFSKDIGTIDEYLPTVLIDSIGILLTAIGIFVNISISNHYVTITLFVLGPLFLLFRSYYIATAKVLKHLEGIAKSPVFSHINSTINGLATIRSSNSTNLLIGEFDDLQNTHTPTWYLLNACSTSFGLWLDILSLLFTISITISFIVLHNVSVVSGSLVGLAITQSMNLTGMLQHAIGQYSELINHLTSVERVLQYTKLDKEGPFKTRPENLPAENWPTQGKIEYNHVSLRYAEEETLVLREINFQIPAGCKIAIVGRTGSGKSSLVAALFKLAPTEGVIKVDDIDTKMIGLTDLRKKISIIPQEPVLFSASLRHNLDPFNEYDDSEIWTALEQVELKDVVDSLDFIVSEGGSNFSLGQRQLICLARASLRNNKILVLDEATANVDPRTDSFIQATIREKFQNCTVITIAHRLNTIMDSDKVLVMNFGNLVEFDHPYKLLQIPNGYFYNMVQETGSVMAQQLKEKAQEAYLKSIF
ncbi:Multi drug resistance-associated protein (MRP) [Diabrotica virgifera virgifera]|nr:Multi drug resistance-associated protein (MRP) [Diabrotica virgifera virgifera]